MSFTKAIYTKSGDAITITEAEAKAVMQALIQNQKWIMVQGEMYSADTIARVGSHESSAEIKRVEVADLERNLIIAGRSDEVDRMRALKKKMTLAHVKRGEELLALPMSAEESERGDVEFYLNGKGEKMYA